MEPTRRISRKAILLVAVFAVCLGVAAALLIAPSLLGKRTIARVVDLSEADFVEKTASGLHLVDFWAVWCGPCRTQGPIVEKLAVDFAGRVAVAKVDVDANGKLAERFGIGVIPTLLVIRDGKEIRRLTGLQSEEELSRILAGLL